MIIFYFFSGCSFFFAIYFHEIILVTCRANAGNGARHAFIDGRFRHGAILGC